MSTSGTSEHLVQMANDIGNYFRADPNRQVALDGIANHINKYWTPRMRKKLLEHVQHGGEGLDELLLAAMVQVRPPPVAGTGPAPDPAPALTPEPHQSPASRHG